MKTSIILLASLFVLALSSCNTSKNFTQKKFLKLDKLVDAKDQNRTNAALEVLDEDVLEMASLQLNGSAVSDEKSDKIGAVDQEEIREVEDDVAVEKVTEDQENREDINLTNDSFQSPASANEIQTLEKSTLKTKTSSDKPNNRDRELAWWVILLLLLGLIIVLPILLIGLIVVYLFFFPAW